MRNLKALNNGVSIQRSEMTKKSIKENSKAKVEIKTLVPGLVNLIKQEGSVNYLLVENNKLVLKTEIPGHNRTKYKPKQDLPILYPSEQVLIYYEDDKREEGLIQDLREFISRYIELPQPGDDLLLSCWVLHTYLADRCNCTPIIYLYGVKETGKTRAMEVLASVAFFAEILTAPTEATIFRAAQYFKTTLFLDELKIWGKDGNPDVANLVKSRYKRGIKVSRINMNKKGEKQVEYYDVFSPLCISSNEKMSAPIEDRSLIFLMQKNVKPEVEAEVDQNEAQNLRDRLTAWRAKHLFEDLPKVNSPARRRLGEITTPLVQAAILAGVNDQILDELAGCITNIAERRKEMESVSFEAEIVFAIKELRDLELTEREEFTTKELTEQVNKERPDNEPLKTRTVGRVVSSLGFRAARVGHSQQRGFFLNEKLLDSLLKRYNLED